ncbi:MAG: PorT family protein [Cytophagales bacterium]|nr:PorT family protein [Cytophagales bacterium]
MKNKLFIILLFVGLGTAVAQSMNARLLLGFNAAQVDGDHLGGYNKLGLVAGASVSFPIKKDTLFFEQEILYSQKGSRNTRNEDAFKYTMHTLETNLLLNYYPVSPRVYLRGGVKIGYLLDASIDRGYGNEDITPLFRSFEMTYVVGIGYDINEKITLNAHFSRGIYSAISSEPFFNRTIRMTMGWKFN